MLTLFAMEHLEERKKSAQKYVKFFIADSVFSVFLPDYSHACHVVDYVLRLSLLRIISASVRASACGVDQLPTKGIKITDGRSNRWEVDV